MHLPAVPTGWTMVGDLCMHIYLHIYREHADVLIVKNRYRISCYSTLSESYRRIQCSFVIKRFGCCESQFLSVIFRDFSFIFSYPGYMNLLWIPSRKPRMCLSDWLWSMLFERSTGGSASDPQEREWTPRQILQLAPSPKLSGPLCHPISVLFSV